MMKEKMSELKIINLKLFIDSTLYKNLIFMNAGG
jgi:hypothetical protein